MSALIEIGDLSKSYESEAGVVQAVRGVSLSIQAGEFVAIMGPSGSGKSTFMNILGCLDTPSSGEYRLAGERVDAQSGDQLADLRNRVIGFVFQGFNLLSRTSLQDNVALPLVYRGLPTAERHAAARLMLEKVGLGGERYALSLPNHISGGQQQRVAIARALVGEPQLILADEPTGNLDTKTSVEIMNLFTQLNRDEGMTVILVTHEPDIAMYAQRLVRLVDGVIAYDGPASQAALAGHREMPT
jgi:putative ABC transport system ATP-binding protein